MNIDLLLGVFGLCLTLGAVIAFLYKGYGSSRLDAYREDMEFYKEKAERIEKERDEAVTKASILENRVTQAKSIDKLITQIGRQNIQMNKNHKEQLEAFSLVTAELSNVAKALAEK